MPLVRVGAFFMLLGNTLTANLAFSDSSWKYFVYIFPANFGQGIIYPSILFTSLASFEHAGKKRFPGRTAVKYSLMQPHRSRRFRFDCISRPISWYNVGGFDNISHRADDAQRSPARGFG